MEETRKLRAEKLRAEKERQVFKDKLKIAKRRLAEFDGTVNLMTGTLEEYNETYIDHDAFKKSRVDNT
jgi:hypothetical protein